MKLLIQTKLCSWIHKIDTVSVEKFADIREFIVIANQKMSTVRVINVHEILY